LIDRFVYGLTTVGFICGVDVRVRWWSRRMSSPRWKRRAGLRGQFEF